MCKIIIGENEFWIKDVELSPEFDLMDEEKKEDYLYENNLLYREDGPAVVKFNKKFKAWISNGRLHRLDVPAVTYSDTFGDYYLDDIRVREGLYQKIQNSSKEELLVYMIDSKYKDYLSLIEYRLS